MKDKRKNKRQKAKYKNSNSAQIIIEFIFCMTILLLMIYGTLMIFKWTGSDLVHRRIAHDELLIGGGGVPLNQIDPYFYTPIKMNAVWSGN
ncbi:MAG: hypothetical protein P9X22_09305 [Candidatus Zapsychrus exili]|nr:hypothetical protein [Candidatus Zapsychrus exili]